MFPIEGNIPRSPTIEIEKVPDMKRFWRLFFSSAVLYPKEPYFYGE